MDQEKRKHIIETAMHMFIENGFHNTPTSKIAKESSVSVGTLFNYFHSKEELIEQIYVAVKLHSKEYITRTFDEEKDDYELVKDMWRAIIRWGLENPDEFRYLSLFITSPFKNLQKDKTLTEKYVKLKKRFKSVFSVKEICSKNPDFTMIYFNNVIHSITEFLLENEVDNEQDFIDKAFDLFWNGFNQK